jgi:hypothetical protein
MRIIFILFITCLYASFSRAQSGIQIRAGFNKANITVNANGRVNRSDVLNSYQIGFFSDIRIGGPVYLQPGIIYTGKGSKVQRDIVGANGFYRQTFNPYYIELPLTFVAKVPIANVVNVFAGAGPYIAIGVRGDVTTEGTTLLGAGYKISKDVSFSGDDPSTFNEEEGAGFGIIKRFDYGFNGTAGIEVKSFVFSVNYGYGLAKLQSGTTNNQDNNNKHRVWSFLVGFKM